MPTSTSNPPVTSGVTSHPWRAVHLVAALLVAGFGLLTLSWVFGNPPQASPDEPSALVKVLATGRLEISGEPFTAPLPPYHGSALGDAWVAEASRSYLLPPGPTPAELSACMAFRPSVTASCLHQAPKPTGRLPVRAATPEGIYPPYLFFPLGLATRAATTQDSAYYLARAASALCSVVLIGLAVACATARRHTAWPVVGLALAVTPMVVFLDASVTTNGVEIAGGICFWAGLVRLAQGRAPRWVWLAAGFGGGVMALARQLDDGWLIAGAAVFVALAGRHQARRRILEGGRAAAAGIAMVAAGGAASLAWDVLVTPSPPISLSVARRAAPTTRGTLELFHQAVGVFGWLDTPLPARPERAWLALVAVLVVAALVVGTWRQRATLLIALVALAAGTVGIQVLVEAQIGYGMQARYSLAMAVAVPVLAAEVIDSRHLTRARVARTVATLPSLVVLVAAAVQWIAYLTNARRYGVGLGSTRSLLHDASWQPPGGTLLWLLVAGAGAACLGAAGAATLVTPRPDAEPHGAGGGVIGRLAHAARRPGDIPRCRTRHH